MPTTTASAASGRLLNLLSLLQARRDWPGGVLADRLDVSERTVRRDVDRLRELGYPIHATKGPDGGYRLEAGTQLPPLLFDDEQAVALTIALQSAVVVAAGVEEAAARALTTVRQVMPARLRSRVDALQVSAVPRGGVAVDTETLLALGAAIRAREEVRFDYVSGRSEGDPIDAIDAPVRLAQPHHLLARSGRWYLLAWVPGRHGGCEDWRTYRVDRMRLRTPGGARFVPREVPGGDVVEFLEARFKGQAQENRWACEGSAVVHRPHTDVRPFTSGHVEELDGDRCRVHVGAWSWPALAASLAGFDAELSGVEPAELRRAFTDLARRATAAAH